jgi:hypothetical protein
MGPNRTLAEIGKEVIALVRYDDLTLTELSRQAKTRRKAMKDIIAMLINAKKIQMVKRGRTWVYRPYEGGAWLGPSPCKHGRT